MRKISFILIVFLTAGICKAQKGQATVSSINNKYFNIMSHDKSTFNVKVKIVEFENMLQQIAEQAKSNGDSTFANQLLQLHATVSYDRKLDSINVELSPLEVDESSRYYNGVVQLKSGFKTSVIGCVKQLTSTVMFPLIAMYESKPIIKSNVDTVFVDVKRSNYTDYYKFYNNYKGISIFSKINGQDYSSTLTADEIKNTLYINSFELIAPTLQTTLKLKYSHNNVTTQLKEANTKVEMPGVNVDVTFSFWDWEIR